MFPSNLLNVGYMYLQAHCSSFYIHALMYTYKYILYSFVLFCSLNFYSILLLSILFYSILFYINPFHYILFVYSILFYSILQIELLDMLCTYLLLIDRRNLTSLLKKHFLSKTKNISLFFYLFTDLQGAGK